MINIPFHVRHGNLYSSTNTKEKTMETEDSFATVEESEIGRKFVTRHWNDNRLVAQYFVFISCWIRYNINIAAFHYIRALY